MVFYTCSGCGESLKKNKVENHYYSCRNCEYLTCIDCNVDFYGNDYKSHTSCMTENEKYSAKGTEFKPNKGEVKQQQWLQNIESVMSSGGNLSQKARGLIKTLSHYDNIPRKKSKFLNFLKNSLRIYDTALGEEIYGAFSSANKTAPKTMKENEVKTTSVDIADTQSSIPKETVKIESPENHEVAQCDLEKKSKKRKKDKENDENQNESSELSDLPKKKKKKDNKTSESEKTEKPPKKKRKKVTSNSDDGTEVKSQTESVTETTNETGDTNNIDNSQEKKKKKKRKKHDHDTNENCEDGDNLQSIDVNDLTCDSIPKKKKKKKSSKLANGEVNN